MKRSKFLTSILIALVTAVVLTACGDASTDSTEQSSDSTQGDASTGREASNSVIVGISQDLDSLDPHNAEYAGTREVLFNLYEGLVKADSTGDLVPAVASDYEIADDATSILFTIREGITFWDGSAVTADDIIYSIERYADIQGSESAFSILESVEAVDEDHVQVNLSEPSTEFIYNLTCAIIPDGYDGTSGDAPQGTGPFVYVSYTPGDELVVEKNENYWKEGYPYLDEVTFKIVTDTDTALLMLNSGTLDIFQYLTSDQAATLDSTQISTQIGSINYVQGMFLNNAAEPFDNVLVRQAIYYAVDRDLINQMLFDGNSHIIGTNMIPAATKYYNTDTETVYTYDVEKAKELLAEAGYEDGFEFTLTVPNNYAPHLSTAEIIVECLAEIGITVNIELVEFTTWYSDVYVDRNYEATVVAVDGTLAPGSWMEKNVSTASDNFTNYNNEEFDELYAQALAETDIDAKADIYKELQMILAEDAASIYIQDPSNILAIRSTLEGYEFYPISAQDMSIVKYKNN